MTKEELIGENSTIGLSEDVNGGLYEIWNPCAIVKNTTGAVCDWLKTRYQLYMRCDGLTESYTLDTEKLEADLMREIETAMKSKKNGEEAA